MASTTNVPVYSESELMESIEPVVARERLIVALDLADAEQAQKMVEELDGVVEFFKIGLTLQLATGVETLIRSLIANGKSVFLDYKYYDIAETLTKAVARVAALGVRFLTVHGSSDCIKGAIQGRGESDLKLFTVTVLTNMDKKDIDELGYTNHTVEQLVIFRARKALEAGCDGVIASGLEAQQIKEMSNRHPGGRRLLVVTPGIRPDGYPEDDQKRRTTPKTAILAGADYLVLGRPITEPATGVSPREAAEQVVQEMQEAFNQKAL